jgi:hypothetical protein
MNGVSGIPEGFWLRRVDYSPVAETIVVCVGYGTEGQYREKVFTRRASDDLYREIEYPRDGSYSYRSVVVGRGQPVIYFNQWQATGGGFSWRSLMSYDLLAKRHREIVNGQSLGKSRWISDLFSTDAAEELLFCSIATEADVLMQQTEVNYHLAEICVSSGSIRSLARLHELFF